MAISLRITLLVLSICLLVYVFHLISQGKLELKYSLLWMVASILLIICAIFPGIVMACSSALGFEVSSNFVFLVGLIVLFGVCLSLTVIISWESRDIRKLIQRCALLEKRVDELEARQQH